MTPALVGKHNFESRCNAKSSNKCLFGPSRYVNQHDFAPAARFAPKTIASAERADKRPLPTDHNANFHQKCKLEDAPVMILMLEVSIRLTILKPASHTYVLLTLPGRYIACMSSCFRPLANRRSRIACFLSPTCNSMPSII